MTAAAKRVCGGFCQLAVMGLASTARVIAIPFVATSAALLGAAGWLDKKAKGQGR